MRERKSDFDEAVEIELLRVNTAMKEAERIAKSDPKKYPSFAAEKAYPALIGRAVAILADSEDEEDMAHNLVHLAACAKSYFSYFVESVSVVVEDIDGQNAPGSEEKN